MGGSGGIIIQNFRATERVLRGKLQKWFVAYKKEIADRKARQIAREERTVVLEKEKEKKKAVREKVLSKLTPEEKKILRIR